VYAGQQIRKSLSLIKEAEGGTGVNKEAILRS
jgi:hypothetical protein